MISFDAYRAQWFGNIRADVLAGLVVAQALIPESETASQLVRAPRLGFTPAFPSRC